MIDKIPQVRGLVPWILMDFRSPTRNIPKLQDGFNRKGLLSEDGKKKQAFYLFQKTYQNHSVGKADWGPARIPSTSLIFMGAK
jgi:beta-glucuronidase